MNLVYFGDAEGATYDLFISAAKNPAVEKFAFFNTGAECAEKYGATAPGIVLVRNFDEPNLPYTGAAELEPLLDFMKGNQVPTIFDFSEDYIEPIFQQNNAAIFLFTNDKSAGYA